MRKPLLPLVLLAVLLGSACAQATPSPQAGGTGAFTTAKKQIVGALFAEPAGLHQELTAPRGTSTSTPGLPELYAMLDGGMTYLDGENVRRPWLADAVPSAENGLWSIQPDGRMETTWHIKSGTKWHDGNPVTAEDLLFTLEVYRDREIGLAPLPSLRMIDGIDALDPETVVVRWQRPYIDADNLFSAGITMWMLPKHILESAFRESKSNFLGLPYWREGFVGAGPFKMQQWTEGSHAVLVANEDYVLGRPRLDQIEVRFSTDRQAIKAALLAGAAQIQIGRGLNVEDILQLGSMTQDVKVQLGGALGDVLPIYPQFIDADPPIVTNLQFRRALLMAIDRQEMTETLNNGLGPVAHTWVHMDTPEGRAVEGSLVRYGYDPRAAVQLIEDLGYTRGQDGIFQARDGSQLSVQIQTHEQNSFHVPATLSVAGYWQRIGLDVTLDVLPVSRATDGKARSLRPAFQLISRGVTAPDFLSIAVPLTDNNFVGGNLARYASRPLDDLVDRYTRTIPFQERMAVLGEMVHFQGDQLSIMPLFFQGNASVLGSVHLHNVLPGCPSCGQGTIQVWNAHLWELD
jgi:peptide/nickel transport system substrate-binding protein